MLIRDADALCEKNKCDSGRVLQEINFHEAKKAKMLTLTDRNAKNSKISLRTQFQLRLQAETTWSYNSFGIYPDPE